MVSIYPTDAKAAPAPSFRSFAKLFPVPGFDKLPAFDAASFTQAFKLPGFDVNTVVDIQRRNVEALTAASQTLVQGLQTVERGASRTRSPGSRSSSSRIFCPSSLPRSRKRWSSRST